MERRCQKLHIIFFYIVLLMNLQIFKNFNLHVMLQVAPPNPRGHTHMNPAVSVMHVPPLEHGNIEQA